ncbi:MAG: multicopper oxidase domain-containing protein [Anaerolineaceae bacterium]|nr:multicopper oxidase domain-containing protein [Anaerolineaceae bacterium]
MVTRREFLKLGAFAGVSLTMPFPVRVQADPGGPIEPFSQSAYLTKFVDPLRGVGGTGIPVAKPDTVNPGWWQPGVDHYTIDIAEFTDRLHSELPATGTRLWGYGQGGDHKHLGGVIVARRDKPVQITFRNNLPPKHIIPIDRSSFFVDAATHPDNRVSTHLHGGFVPWISDGGPMAFWDPNGLKGESFLNNQVLRPGQVVPPNQAEYYYPNQQGARLMWYHDHAHDITRVNAYAGIASAYVITDDYEDLLVAGHHLPGPLDTRTVYLVFQDKTFVSANLLVHDAHNTDPTWTTIMPDTREGDLWYEHQYASEVGPGFPPPTDNPSIVPEFFGDTILVNGTAYPFLEVEPRQYRLRLLNACNGRFLNPRLVSARSNDTSLPDSTEPTNSPGPAFLQIGNEGGFIPTPVLLNGPGQPQLLLAPAERADFLVDFRSVAPGTVFILYNDAPAPFPNGDDAADYYPGNPYNPFTVQPGKGPNSRTLLQVRVKARTGAADAPITLPKALTPTDPFLVTQTPNVPTPIPNGLRVRYLTLNEDFDAKGRLIQFLGTDKESSPALFGRAYDMPATEMIAEGDTEVWEIINLTADAHPIHFHLTNAQILSRQYFDTLAYKGGAPSYIGDEIAPDLNELGWKETVRMYPGQVTRLIMKFNLPVVPFPVPQSPRTGGHEYVWHCHILEHEEHDMMRPLVIVGKTYIPFVNNG